MKVRAKKFLFVFALFFCAFVSLVGTWLWYLNHYVHQHCIKQTGLAFHLYAEDHNGQLPYSTNGFGNALLLLASTNYLMGTACICGPGDDGHIFKDALINNSVAPETKCSRVYIQGLNETNDPRICVLFDRSSCKGGDHFRSPWGHLVREVCLLDGSMQVIRDEDWPEFSRNQVELLVAAGFSRTNALYFYPAAK